MATTDSRAGTATIDTGRPLPPTPAPKRGRGKWMLTAILFLIVLPLAAFALWVSVTLNFSYSNGTRVGELRKFSQKGWVCKTWEGELAVASGPAVVPQIFEFSVRDDQVATQLESANGQYVRITYEQHRGVPTRCFGETEYYVTKVEPMQVQGGPVLGPGGLAPSAPPSPATPSPASGAPASPAPAAPSTTP
jgi:hypothetical protein